MGFSICEPKYSREHCCNNTRVIMMMNEVTADKIKRLSNKGEVVAFDFGDSE